MLDTCSMLGSACHLLKELSQVWTTASSSSLPLSWTLFKIICSHHPCQLPHAWCFFFFCLCVYQRCLMVLWGPSLEASPDSFHPLEPRNVWGLLFPLHHSPVCTSDRTLPTWFPSSLFICLSPPAPSPDSEQCESRIFSLISHVSWKPVSEFGRTHIGREERNEVKWNEIDILGKWAHGVSLSASCDGISISSECVRWARGWEVLLSKYYIQTLSRHLF